MGEKQKCTYRKCPWRFLFAACAVYGSVKLLGGPWVNLISPGIRLWDRFSTDTMSVSIGVIGGADGPTAIFVTAPPWVQYAVPAVMLLVGIWGFVRLSRCKPKE